MFTYCLDYNGPGAVYGRGQHDRDQVYLHQPGDSCLPGHDVRLRSDVRVRRDFSLRLSQGEQFTLMIKGLVM